MSQPGQRSQPLYTPVDRKNSSLLGPLECPALGWCEIVLLIGHRLLQQWSVTEPQSTYILYVR
jgi:hypothetical protein